MKSRALTEANVNHGHALGQSEERFRLLVESVKDYAIFMLDTQGYIVSWNEGARRLKGYQDEEIIGQHFSIFYDRAEVERGKPQMELEVATRTGVYEEEGWRIRKDGSRFWANVVITALRSPDGSLTGFGKVTRDMTERMRAERMLADRTAELEATVQEIEAFSYTVSHDLRAPLRAIDGFSLALLEDYGDKLDKEGQHYLKRLRAASQRMGLLIDSLLELSRLTRAEKHDEDVDLSAIARLVAQTLTEAEPGRSVQWIIQDGVHARGDQRLLHVALQNLLGNAWKFTSRRKLAKIEFGVTRKGEGKSYFVRDNGAGFDMEYADKLFRTFQRLHDETEFTGTGVGLATVNRIVARHGGRIWADAAPDVGATFYFTLGNAEQSYGK